jgi:hypothetical protein
VSRISLRCHVLLWPALAITIIACSSKSTSGADAGDGSTEASVCGEGLGADNLSFTVSCTDGCTASRKVTFNVSPGDRENAPCVDSGGHLQLYQLVGNDQSVFELDLEPNYMGVGNYTVTSPGLMAYSNVEASCSNVGQVPLLLSIPDATDPQGTCNVSVTEDCLVTGGRHAVSGTLSCALPLTDRGANCKLTDGKFSFKTCE